jgi:chromate transport protein ChrA
MTEQAADIIYWLGALLTLAISLIVCRVWYVKKKKKEDWAVVAAFVCMVCAALWPLSWIFAVLMAAGMFVWCCLIWVITGGKKDE